MRLFGGKRKDDKRMMERRMMEAMQAHYEYQMYQQQNQQQQHQHQKNPQYQQQYVKPPPNQYEYVRREHGYDFMPPSQYVPSRSLSEETDEDMVDPPVRIEVPASDISDSVYAMDYDPFKNSRRKPPVVRGKTVKPSRTTRKTRGVPLQPLPEQYDEGVSMDDRERLRHRERIHRSRSGGPQPGDSSYYEKETVKARTNHRRSRSGDPVLLAQAAPDISGPVVRRDETQRRHSPLQLTHPSFDRTKRRGGVDEDLYDDDGPVEVPEVPTAFSYNSDDSKGALDSSKSSRYDIEKEEHYRKLVALNARKNSFSGEKDRRRRSTDKRRHGEPLSSLESFTTPAYGSRNRDHEMISGRMIDSPHDVRRRNHDPRYRSHNKDARDPMDEYEDPPLGMDPRLRKGTRGLDRGNNFRESPYFEEQGIEQIYNEDPLVLKKEYKERKRMEALARKDKGKIKGGFFTRIKDSVRGERPNQHVLENAWGQELREKGSLFEKEPASLESNLSPHPPLLEEYHIPDARVPYPYDNAHYELPTHRPSSRLLQDPVLPPQAYPRRNSPYDPRFSQPPDHNLHEANPQMRYGYASGKPFQTSRPVTPALRANPDHRQRHIPLATSMSKHYRSQHQQALGTMRGGGLGNQSPRGLQFDPNMALSTPRNKGVIGCF